MSFWAVAVSSPRMGRKNCSPPRERWDPGARIGQPRSGAILRGGFLSPLPGLARSLAMIPTAYAVGYKSTAPVGRRA